MAGNDGWTAWDVGIGGDTCEFDDATAVAPFMNFSSLSVIYSTKFSARSRRGEEVDGYLAFAVRSSHRNLEGKKMGKGKESKDASGPLEHSISGTANAEKSPVPNNSAAATFRAGPVGVGMLQEHSSTLPPPRLVSLKMSVTSKCCRGT